MKKRVQTRRPKVTPTTEDCPHTWSTHQWSEKLRSHLHVCAGTKGHRGPHICKTCRATRKRMRIF